MGRIDALHRAVSVAVKWCDANKQDSQKHKSCGGSNTFHPNLP
jgi:hypothetical protein